MLEAEPAFCVYAHLRAVIAVAGDLDGIAVTIVDELI